jgi:hypothetical protein
MTTVAQVKFQESVGMNWAVVDPQSEGPFDVVSFHGSWGNAAKVASSIPRFVVAKLSTEMVLSDPDDEESELVEVVSVVEDYTQDQAQFWSYPS